MTIENEWTVTGEGEYSAIRDFRTDEVVAEVRWLPGQSIETHRATVGLMASAPILLAALKATLPALIRLGDFVGNVDQGGASGQGRIDRCALIMQVRNAIESGE